MDGHARRNAEAFAKLTAAEDEHFRWQAEKIDLIKQCLGTFNPHGTLADVGCFTGAATVSYGSVGFKHVVGFDASHEALEQLAERGIEPRYWRAGEEACPAQDEEFDAIVAADIIEHIVDTDYFVSELHRVLHPDGRLIITTPNLTFWLSRLRFLFGKPPWSYPGASPTVKADLMIDLNHIRVATRSEWKTLFQQRAFTVETLKGWSLLHAIEGGVGTRARQVIDRWMTRFPDCAFGLLFVLKKS